MLAYAGVTRRSDQWDDCSDAPAQKNSFSDIMGSTDCPERLHASRHLPCRCLYLLRLDAYLREKVFFSWHRDAELPLSCFRLNEPATASRGGQGVVFYVHDVGAPSKKFALKFKDRQERNGDMWTLEKREMAILSQVQHPFIVKLLHSYETRRGLFMAMEFLSSGTLWSLIYRCGVLSEASGVYFSAAMVDALHYLHEQDLIFRDLKAENVALDHLGRPRLIDFGLAKAVGSRGDNCPMTRYDFVSYLAPEIYRSPDKCDFKVDSWGVGFFLTELLLGYGITQAIPWEVTEGKNHLAEDWRLELAPHEAELLSESCRSFLETMLCRDPARRPTMGEAKALPFFCEVQWSALSTALPPEETSSKEPSSCPQEIDSSPQKPSQGDLNAKEDQEEAKEVEEVEEEEEEEYHAILNAPTIGSDNNAQCPRLKYQVQLQANEKFSQPSRQRSEVRKTFFQTIGNL